MSDPEPSAQHVRRTIESGAIGAIVLAGGRGSRLGGVDKAAIELDGRTLLDRLLAALDGFEGSGRIDVVVVGPPRPQVRTVAEQPRHGGPAAAVATGLAALPDAAELLLLAVDVPGVPGALDALLAAESGADGAVATDAAGRTQWLLGRYRAAALRAAAARRDDWTGRPLRELLQDLDLARVPLPPDATRDVDTVADALAAGVRLPTPDDETTDDEEGR